MDKSLIKKQLLELIPSATDVDAQTGVYIKMRCFMCGDSKKNDYKKRLYVKIDINNPTEPIFFNCFNCLRTGIVNDKFIAQAGVQNFNVISNIRQFNKEILTSTGDIVYRKKYENNIPIDVKLPPIKDSTITLKKLKYFYSRIGYRIPIEDLGRLKIVFNLYEFLEFNKIPIKETRSSSLLNDNYVGVLSRNNDYIIFRETTGTSSIKHMKYNIFNTHDNTNSFYAIRNIIDIFSHDEIDLIVAEGVYDIVSIFYNVYNSDISNKVYIASCNGSFVNPIFYYINRGILGKNVNIKCFQDNDTKFNFNKFRNEVQPYVNKIEVFYNTKGKDFGVPKKDIEVAKILY